MKKLLLILLVSIPLPVSACWQLTGPPPRIQNTSIKGRLTHDNKPIANSPVLLQTATKKFLARTRTDKNGWFAFRNLGSGEYRVTLKSPSYEPFDVALIRTTEQKTQLSINFSADWCNDVNVVPDK